MPTIFDSLTQEGSTDAIVSLFKLDATSVNGGVHYFCQSSEAGADVVFDGITYTAADVRFSGLVTNGVGSMPTPTFELNNSDGFAQALVNTVGDMLGSTVQRIRTFKRFLDGQPQADPTAYFGPDIFRVERKASESAISIEWELSASIDQEGKLLPGRLVVRNTCLWRYRIWDAGQAQFDYTKAQCPYVGATSYDINGDVTTAANDYPSRDLNCCKLRFGADEPWPYGGFPGVGRIRP